MTTAVELVDVLKRELRARGLTYAALAQRLELSEAAVKRMFARRRMSLERIDDICTALDLELSDLVRRKEQDEHRIGALTEAQETELVGDLRLLLVAVCVTHHWRFEEIVDAWDIAPAECVRHLAHLDRIGLIELLPGNAIRLRFREDFRWLPEGPIERFFEADVIDDFLTARFESAGAMRLFLQGFLSRRAQEVLLRALDDLSHEFHRQVREDYVLPAQQRAHTGLFVALRPWRFAAFEPLLRAHDGTPAIAPTQRGAAPRR
ncbi:MAG: helix-turn-helix transcriptional regulator [Gammaproteobacteria bacterium]